jgi:hypothetical protein
MVGFNGSKVVLANDINDRLKDNLIQSGYQVVKYERENSTRRFYTARHVPLVKYLKENYSSFRYTIFSDIRDVVYQTNPSDWLEKHLSPRKIVGITESIKFKDEKVYNDPQMLHLCSTQGTSLEYRWMREQDVCNYGLLAGESKEMYEIISKIQDVLNSDSGDLIDQAVLNCVIRTSPFKEVATVTDFSEGFGAQLHWVQTADKKLLTNEVPRLDKETGLVYPAGKDEPFAALHHYDQDPEWGTPIHKRYET